jgi:hypothetical protein
MLLAVYMAAAAAVLRDLLSYFRISAGCLIYLDFVIDGRLPFTAYAGNKFGTSVVQNEL